MFCTQCGKPLPEGAAVCPNCGAPVKGAIPVQAPAAPAAVPADTAAAPAAEPIAPSPVPAESAPTEILPDSTAPAEAAAPVEQAATPIFGQSAPAEAAASAEPAAAPIFGQSAPAEAYAAAAAQQPYAAAQQPYAAAQQPYAAAQQPYAAPQQPYAAAQQPYAAPVQPPMPGAAAPKKNKGGLAVLIVVLSVLAAAVLGAVWFFLIRVPDGPDETALAQIVTDNLGAAVTVDGVALLPADSFAVTVTVGDRVTDKKAKTDTIDCSVSYASDSYTVAADYALALAYSRDTGWVFASMEETSDPTLTVNSAPAGLDDTAASDIAGYWAAAAAVTPTVAEDLADSTVTYTYDMTSDHANMTVSGTVELAYTLTPDTANSYYWVPNLTDTTTCDWSKVVGTWNVNFTDDDGYLHNLTFTIDSVGPDTMHISEEVDHYEYQGQTADDALTTYEPDGIDLDLYEMELGKEYEYYSELTPILDSTQTFDSIGVCYGFNETSYIIFYPDEAYWSTYTLNRVS